jgi:hypothetical protein
LDRGVISIVKVVASAFARESSREMERVTAPRTLGTMGVMVMEPLLITCPLDMWVESVTAVLAGVAERELRTALHTTMVFVEPRGILVDE